MAAPASPLPVPPELQRGEHRTREQWEESGRFAVDLLCRTLDREDLAEVELLDVGCGTKVVKTLLDRSLPIGRYAGIDASAAVISWLQANVSDPRFEFHHLNAHNAMYNPEGVELASFESLPVGQRRFDLISLFSVFTHLAPHDFDAMLRLLRGHAKPQTRLVFSLFLQDPGRETEYKRAIDRQLASDDPAVRRRAQAALERGIAHRAAQQDLRFIDAAPDRPLEIATYEREYALELIGRSGWEVLELRPPERYIQHRVICIPARAEAG